MLSHQLNISNKDMEEARTLIQSLQTGNFVYMVFLTTLCPLPYSSASL
jgi:hypothetical protein